MSAGDVSGLERRLRDLGAHLDVPPAPDLTARVSERIERRPRRLPPVRVLAVAFAVLLLGGGTVLAASPGARDAVLRFLHLRGATVERVDRLPQAPARGPFLGTPATLAHAARAAELEPLVPAALGAPDGVFVLRAAGGRAVTLAYGDAAGRSRLRLVVTELRGDLEPSFVGKMLGPGSTVEALTVDGREAAWIGGEPHVVLFRRPDGSIAEDTIRLAGNVLLVQRGAVLVRLEGRLGRGDMVRIARSLAPVPDA